MVVYLSDCSLSPPLWRTVGILNGSFSLGLIVQVSDGSLGDSLHLWIFGSFGGVGWGGRAGRGGEIFQGFLQDHLRLKQLLRFLKEVLGSLWDSLRFCGILGDSVGFWEIFEGSAAVVSSFSGFKGGLRIVVGSSWDYWRFLKDPCGIS